MVELKITLDNINYSEVAEQAVPIILEKLKESKNSKIAGALSVVGDLSGNTVGLMLKVLPQKTKDEIAVKLINHYKNEISNELVKMIGEKGISLTINEINVENIKNIEE